MQRLASFLAAVAVVCCGATPALAHHYHEHHGYDHGYHGAGAYLSQFGIFYNSGCEGYMSQGGVAYDEGNYDLAIADYTQAIALDRHDAAAYNNRAAAWDAKNELDKALADANLALALDPRYTGAYVSRGAIWFNKGEYDKAIADDNVALAFDPTCAQAYADRAEDWDMKGDYAKAQADFNQAIAADANCAAFYNDLAFFQATCLDARFRDAGQAFANASKAYQLSGGNNADNNFSVLASAYAENGDFAQAIAWQQKALDLTTSQEMKQRYLARLALFKQSKPFRVDPKTAMQVPAAIAQSSN